MKIKFGAGGFESFTGETVFDRIERVKMCEAHGLDAVFMSDHLDGYANISEKGFPDLWTFFGAISVLTKTVKFGSHVTDPFRRSPGTLAATITCLDILSGGRVILGIGATDPHYVEPFGIKWDHAVSRLAETIDILKLLWTGEPVTYNGRFWKLKDALLKPTPIQKPHPPIWVAGNSPKTMELTGRVADGWMTFGGTLEQYAMDMETVKTAAEKAGRNPDKILITAGVPSFVLAKNPEAARKQYVAAQEKIRSDPKAKIGGLCAGVAHSRRLGVKIPGLDNYSLEELHKMDIFKLQDVARAYATGEAKKREPLFTPEDVVNAIEKYVEIGARYFTASFKSKEEMEIFTDKVMPQFV